MRFHLIMVFCLLVVSGLVARHQDVPADDAFERDLEACLSRYCDGAPVQARLGPLIWRGRDLRVRLSWPHRQRVKPTQQAWLYDITRLVERRHPQVKVGEVSLLDGTSLISDHKHPGFNRASAEYEWCESLILRRDCREVLDQHFKDFLVLVDITSRPQNNPDGLWQFTIDRLDCCLVLSHYEDLSKATGLASQALGLETARGDTLRVVVLPQR